MSEVSAGTVADVPPDLRGHVAGGSLARRYVTIAAGGVEIPTLIIGQPVRTAGRDLEFYLLFPLDAEQRTLSLVQSTLIVGGLVLLLLLAGIASLVTRQVVRPVRQAAEIAERFADGHLDERMPVHGNDEVARLGRVVQRDGRQHPDPDPPARGVRGAAAAVHLGRQPRAAHALDHRADGGGRPARLQGPAAARPAPQLGAAGDGARPVRGAARATCWRSAGWTRASRT